MLNHDYTCLIDRDETFWRQTESFKAPDFLIENARRLLENNVASTGTARQNLTLILILLNTDAIGDTFFRQDTQFVLD